MDRSTVNAAVQSLFLREVKRRFSGGLSPGSTDIEVLVAADVDAWDIRGTWINGYGPRSPFRLARRHVSPRDLRGGTAEVVDVIARAVHSIVAELFPLPIPFRIATRSPRRLQIARTK